MTVHLLGAKPHELLDLRDPRVEQIQAERYDIDDRDGKAYDQALDRIAKLILGKTIIAVDTVGPDFTFDDGSILEIRGVDGTDLFYWHLKGGLSSE